MTHNPTSDPDRRNLRLFIVSVSLTVAVCVSGGFLGMAVRERGIIRDEMAGRVPIKGVGQDESQPPIHHF